MAKIKIILRIVIKISFTQKKNGIHKPIKRAFKTSELK
jgi:hypothetical protein